MLEIDGITATGKILEHFDGQYCLLIISLTANALKKEQQRCLDVGMTGFISKPIMLSDIKTKSCQALSQPDFFIHPVKS